MILCSVWFRFVARGPAPALCLLHFSCINVCLIIVTSLSQSYLCLFSVNCLSIVIIVLIIMTNIIKSACIMHMGIQLPAVVQEDITVGFSMVA